MNDLVSVIFMVLVCYIAFSSLILLFGLLITKKFNNKYRKIYSIFIGLTFREISLLSITFLNLVLVLYFLFNIGSFYPIGLIMIVVTNFFSCLLSFNVRLIIVDIIYTSVSCLLLWLLMVVNDYFNYVGFNNYILALIIIFSIMIIIYVIFITTRKLNLLINIHRKNGGYNGK